MSEKQLSVMDAGGWIYSVKTWVDSPPLLPDGYRRAFTTGRKNEKGNMVGIVVDQEIFHKPDKTEEVVNNTVEQVDMELFACRKEIMDRSVNPTAILKNYDNPFYPKDEK